MSVKKRGIWSEAGYMNNPKRIYALSNKRIPVLIKGKRWDISFPTLFFPVIAFICHPVLIFKSARARDYPACFATFPQRNINFIQQLWALSCSYLVIHWVNVSYCQRIHITTCITIHSGPIAGSLRCCYVGLLTWKCCAIVHWHFHFAPL